MKIPILDITPWELLDRTVFVGALVLFVHGAWSLLAANWTALLWDAGLFMVCVVVFFFNGRHNKYYE